VAATVVTVLIVHEIVDRVGGRLEYDLVSITTLRFLLRSILVGGSLVVVGVPEVASFMTLEFTTHRNDITGISSERPFKVK
jgi:hypothetical protein